MANGAHNISAHGRPATPIKAVAPLCEVTKRVANMVRAYRICAHVHVREMPNLGKFIKLESSLDENLLPNRGS